MHPGCAASRGGPGGAECRRLLGDWGPAVRFVDVTASFIAPEAFRGLQSIKGFPLSYAVMCEFWAAKVFELAEVRSLRHFLRFDSDTTMSCHPSAPDVFQLLEQRGAQYGYYVLSRDDPQVSEGFVQHLHDHSVLEMQTPKDFVPESGSGGGAPLF